MWRLSPNSEFDRASSPSFTGSRLMSPPDNSIRSPGSGSSETIFIAASCAPASSGPQK
jgi:hypothetical protein